MSLLMFMLTSLYVVVQLTEPRFLFINYLPLSPRLRTSAVTYGVFVRLCLSGITFLHWTSFIEGVGEQVQVNICVIQDAR